jgi:predicted glycosyltransferase
VDGLNLIWYSDLVISGGGTMNREAAALGVPVYSIFRGHIGAVDRHLAAAGRLLLLESVEDVRNKLVVKQRNQPVFAELSSSDALETIIGHIVTLVEEPHRGIPA